MNTVGNTKTPAVYWADEITVKRKGTELMVRGIRHPLPLPETFARRDLVGNYAEALAKSAREKGGANDAPHLKFLRADTDEELQAFVNAYGPIYPIAPSVVLRSIRVSRRSATQRDAIEDLPRLHRERNTFLAATGLLNEVKSQRPDFNRMIECVDQLWMRTSSWLSEWEEEENCRRKFAVDGPRPWIWTPWLQREIELKRNYCRSLRPITLRYSNRPATNKKMLRAMRAYENPPDGAARAIVEPSHEILCAVLNGFPVYATRWKGMSLEFPSEETLFGIRPALYHLLRCDYFSDVHIARCPCRDCPTKWFRQDRRGQIFCNEDCERRNRQREYYLRKGKKTKSDYYQNTIKPRRHAKSVRKGD